MIEVKTDLWKYPCYWICVPTNGVVNEAGEAELPVEVVQKRWDAPFLLGEQIIKKGNIVQEIGKFTRENYVPKAPENCYQLKSVVVTLFALPVNTLEVIENSCKELVSKYNVIVSANKWQWPRRYVPIVCLPKIGGENWDKQVKPLFEKYFVSDDFVICHT